MPFTPYHWGPPILLIGLLQLLPSYRQLPGRIWVDLAMLYGAVIPDLQGFYSVFFDKSVPIHGFSHTILGALLYALFSVLLFEGFFVIFGFDVQIRLSHLYLVIFGSIFLFHFIPDMFIWSDMRIFWPLSDTSFGDERRYQAIADWMGRMFLFGLILSIFLLIRYHRPSIVENDSMR